MRHRRLGQQRGLRARLAIAKFIAGHELGGQKMNTDTAAEDTAGVALPDIPVIDAGRGGPLCHAALSRDRALALRDDCLTVFPPPVKPFLPALDGVARRWLSRSCSPYVPDIAQIAAALGFPGVWLLNGSYQWGCTALAREEDGVPWLARTLDWPFPGLGRHTDVVRAETARRRLLERHLARLRGRPDRNGAAPLRRQHQPGAHVAPHLSSMVALVRPSGECAVDLDEHSPHAARPFAAPGLRDL